jgi:hypothetical protein
MVATVVPEDEAVPEVVELAEELLALAKSGEMRSVAIAGIMTDDRRYVAFRSEEPWDMKGAVSQLNHRIGLWIDADIERGR